jgi:hypothetical protein
MKRIKKLKTVLRFILLTGSALLLAACHAPQPEASPELDLPPLERSIKAAEILPDGSVRISSKQLVKHIGTDGVFILSADKRARFRMVKAGKRRGESITISSGLTGKEQVLNGPYDSIFDGSPVHVVETQMRTKQ